MKTRYRASSKKKATSQIISRGALEHEMRLKAHALRKLGIDIAFAPGESGVTFTSAGRFTRDGQLHWRYHIAADEGTNTKVYIPTLLTSGTPNDPAFIVRLIYRSLANS